ncbi:deoxyribodipyrimidine photo-lyase [Candidatus Woesearchaeota archaeon]|nr:deoxyribodipyrimidine photo-lyase [Nanoarchaeota archaeon]MCB9370530.1 deoxyribodipyrimidine photo-lyase [Candidatus Woesearchaeota archaeon]USN43606.1 MAG: deoxyribodipyrimidine photo-lyase [Candidatus Woesearchaeota archaeon]
MQKKRFTKSLFIFRRDLRLEDNTALYKAFEESEELCLFFLFTPEQIEKNPYRSNNALEFLFASLSDLQKRLQKGGRKLHIFYGEALVQLQSVYQEYAFEAVFVNKDYTPYSRERDKKIEDWCKKKAIQFQSFDDTLLTVPEQTCKKDKTPYTVFTPYYHHVRVFPVRKPMYISLPHSTKDFTFSKEKNLSELEFLFLPNRNAFLALKGGRKEGLKLLQEAWSRQNSYANEKDLPFKNATTKLSAHHKFGTISIRETYHSFLSEVKDSETFLRQLYWRDFFVQIAYFFPHVFGHAFHKKYDALHWEKNEKAFELWKEGKTGFPIVDAGMRELKKTGFMHNRVRMIAASFLVKDLHIDWRLGEKYFAQQLIDYDPCVNNGSWQWVASTGCDAQPYFRIFNPWRQQDRFDSECLYVKYWLPELEHLSPKEIHALHKRFPLELESVYPKPIVVHEDEAHKAFSLYCTLQK